MTNDERKALEPAQAALNMLTPATTRDDAIVFDLRYALRHLAVAQPKALQARGPLTSCALPH